MKSITVAFFISLLLTTAAFSINYDEPPELSGSPTLPTQLGTLTNGSNVVSGRIGFGDRDCFTFVVPSGSVLTNLIVVTYNGILDLGSIYLDAGATSQVPFPGNSSNFLGGLNFSFTESGTDILDDLASGLLGTTGFSTPLGAGVYTIVFTDVEAFNNTYALDFVIAGGGGGGGTGLVTIVAGEQYQRHAFQADAMISRRRSRGFTGRNLYHPNPRTQQLLVPSINGRTVRGFLTVENDGIGADQFSLRGGRSNRRFRVKYIRRTGGLRNVTSEFVQRTHTTPFLNRRERVVYEVRISPVRSRLRSRRGGLVQTGRIFTVTARSVVDRDSFDAINFGTWIENR